MPTARNEKWWHYAVMFCVLTAFTTFAHAVWFGCPANWDGWLENLERGVIFAIPYTVLRAALDRFRARRQRA